MQRVNTKILIMKRWVGDISGKYKYIEKERRELKFYDLSGGMISLDLGIYQFKYNSVSSMRGMTSGYYGQSDFFEVESGEDLIEVGFL